MPTYMRQYLTHTTETFFGNIWYRVFQKFRTRLSAEREGVRTQYPEKYNKFWKIISALYKDGSNLVDLFFAVILTIFLLFRLVHEVKNLQMTLANLKMRLQEEQEQLQKLVTARANLEHEIRTKANSIFIDQEKCMSMRKTFPTTPRLSGYAY